jgi:hypothetical protein
MRFPQICIVLVYLPACRLDVKLREGHVLERLFEADNILSALLFLKEN